MPTGLLAKVVDRLACSWNTGCLLSATEGERPRDQMTRCEDVPKQAPMEAKPSWRTRKAQGRRTRRTAVTGIQKGYPAGKRQARRPLKTGTCVPQTTAEVRWSKASARGSVKGPSHLLPETGRWNTGSGRWLAGQQSGRASTGNVQSKNRRRNPKALLPDSEGLDVRDPCYG